MKHKIPSSQGVSSSQQQSSMKLLDTQITPRDYTLWLTSDAQRTRVMNSQEWIARYLGDALRAVLAKGRQIRTFAPFRQQHSPHFADHKLWGTSFVTPQAHLAAFAALPLSSPSFQKPSYS
jgi:hypothetical protein